MAERAAGKNWSLLEMIQWSSDYLAEKGFHNGRLLAERLLAHVLQLRRVDLYLQFDRPLAGAELAEYKALFLRLVAHEPLQYLLGETEFMSLPFRVGPGVLIPRPETELLVEKTLARAEAVLEQQETVHIADLGTGSGCIAIALAHHLPVAQLLALDNSAAALKWAAENRELNGVTSRVRLKQHDLAQPPLPEWRGRFDLVVSNPPYVREAEWQVLDPEVRDHEPKSALSGGADGLDVYRTLRAWLPFLLRESGEAFLEIGCGMGVEVIDLFSEAGFSGSALYQDLAGKERLVHLFSPGGIHESRDL